MKILKAVTASLMLAALPLASHAEDMSYSNIDLGYVNTDIDGIGPSFDGFGARGSVGFALRVSLGIKSFQRGRCRGSGDLFSFSRVTRDKVRMGGQPRLFGKDFAFLVHRRK